MTENQISKVIVDAAVEVHRQLGGPGLLEDVYEEALEEELRLRGLQVERQLPIRLIYKGRVLRKALRLDLRIEKLVLVDNKAVTDCIHRVVNGLAEEVDFNAKPPRRGDAKEL